MWEGEGGRERRTGKRRSPSDFFARLFISSMSASSFHCTVMVTKNNHYLFWSNATYVREQNRIKKMRETKKKNKEKCFDFIELNLFSFFSILFFVALIFLLLLTKDLFLLKNYLNKFYGHMEMVSLSPYSLSHSISNLIFYNIS